MFKIITLFLLSITLLGGPSLKEIDITFEKVAKRYDIPPEILKAIAYKKSGWHINNTQSVNFKDNRGEYGIMGLSMDNIKIGSSILGKTELVDAIINYKTNIEITAIILNKLKDEFYTNGIIIKTIEDYAPLVVEYNNSKYQLLSKNFVKKIYRLINNGYIINRKSNSLFVQGINLDLSVVEYPEVVAFYKTYTQINSLEDVETHWSPNKYDGRGGNTIDQVIIHIMQGTFSGSESWFMNPSSNVSANYLISNTGEILQMVRLTDRAWHAGNHNGRSIGIEHEGFWHSDVHSDTVITEDEYQASAMITRWLTERYNIPRIHRDAYHDENGNFVPWQLQRPELSNMAGILGHHDCNGKEKCPGGDWNWNYYMELVGGETNNSTGNLTLLFPTNNETVDNPVTFRARVDGDIVKVKYFADGTYLLGESVEAGNDFKVEYRFTGIGNRTVSAKGYDSQDRYISGTEIEIQINIIEAGDGTTNFLIPADRANTPNPVIMKSRVSGDVVKVKYFAEGTIFLGESSNSGDDFRVERLFNQTGNRFLVARGYTSNDIYITGAEDIILVAVQEECTPECTLGEKRCNNNSVEQCVGENSCTVWEIVDGCSNGEVCIAGACVEDSCESQCNVGEKRCLDNSTVERCINRGECNNWESTENCNNNEICLSGHCIEANDCTNECNNLNEKKCFGNSIKKCGQFDDDNCLEWREIDSCDGSQTCFNGSCIDECTSNCYRENDKKCLGDMVQICIKEGNCLKWKNQNSCSGGNICDNGECVSSCSDQCSENEKRCIGDIVEICKNNFDTDSCLEWGKLEGCDKRGESCGNGECSPSCIDECDELGDIECDGNLVKICQKSQTTECYELVTSRECTNGKICSRGTCMSSTCVSTCNTYGDLSCEGINVAICTNDTDGCLSTTVVESCSSDDYCAAGRCIEKNAGKVCNAGTKICQGKGTVLICNEAETEYLFSSNCIGDEKCVSGFCKIEENPKDPNINSAQDDGWCNYSTHNDFTFLFLFLFFISLKIFRKRFII